MIKQLCVGLALLIGNVTAEEPLVKSISIITSCFPVDVRDDKVLVGISHNVFVGKILEEHGVVDLKGIPMPYTRYSVKVIENIKGALSGEVFVDVGGGVKGGVLYLLEGVKPREKLAVGRTYVFTTRSPAENTSQTYLAFEHPRIADLISSDASKSVYELKLAARGASRVASLRTAYKNEVIPEGFKDDARNSYAKTKVFSR